MSIGVWQVVIVLVIVLIIFGAGKLPQVMGDVAKGIKNFKSGMSEDDSTAKKSSIEEKAGDVGTASSKDTSKVKAGSGRNQG